MFIGQTRIKGIIDNAIETSKKLNTVVPHILLYSKPGYGKTTIAYYISEQIGSKFHHLIGPKVSYRDICTLLVKLQAKDIIFIDEIHGLDRETEEFLYPIIEEFKLVFKNQTVPVPHFTLVGATTNIGKISKPLVDRCIYNLHLDNYSVAELLEISKQKAEELNITIDNNGHELIVKSCKETPRIIKNLVHTTRDYITAQNLPGSEKSIAAVLESLEIKDGLSKLDRQYLKLLSYTPIGLSQIASMLGTDVATIENSVEPYLIEKGLVTKTQRGRIKKSKGGDDSLSKIMEAFQ